VTGGGENALNFQEEDDETDGKKERKKEKTTHSGSTGTTPIV